MSAAELSVAFLPTDPNPYQSLLAAGLAASDVDVAFIPRLPSAGWLREQRGRVDILHFHWLHKLYMARYRTPLQAAAFLSRFRLARQLGYKVVWTAHNTMPHKRRPRPLHLLVRRMMMAEADAVIVHCEAGRRELLARFPRSGPLYTIPLGDYGGVYPRTMTRDMARERLGLRPDQFAFLFLGNLAPYKGLERLVSVFKSDADRTDALFIAGNPLDTALAERLTLAIEDDPRIHLEARTISDDEMQVYLLAGDAFVAPFEEVLTSSSVLLGLSWGLPAVVPALGCLPELVGDDAGIVYIPGSDQALATSLHEIKGRDLATMRAAASQTAAALDWNTIGRRMADVYRACLHP